MAELVTEYFEGTLAWHARLGARLHLVRCDACRHYFDQMRKTIRLLADHPIAPPAPPLVERLVTEGKRRLDGQPGI
ncbi:MAG: hypothetical protein P4L71_00635 [Acetobacteraceae bacterium]|nr:hypothetical protein [Acetobacteraceae bacterium]